jgi:hypothetical protein
MLRLAVNVGWYNRVLIFTPKTLLQVHGNYLLQYFELKTIFADLF